MDQASINREFVNQHFEAVNRRDVQTVVGNMRSDLYDHELEGDHKNDLQEGAQRLQVLMKQVPDLTVDVRDHLVGPGAEGFLAWRAPMSDEQWVEWRAISDEQWVEYVRQNFHLNVSV